MTTTGSALPQKHGADGRFVAADVNDAYFAGRSPHQLWLAGLVAADGCIARDGARWSLSQSGPEGLARVQHAAYLISYQGRIASYQPIAGQRSYSITVTSRRMVSDLAARYGVFPAKSLTYSWPSLASEEVAPFLRGWFEGDGCVGVYLTRAGRPFLHMSYVGTGAFVAEATSSSPAGARIFPLSRCPNTSEVRYSGRFAWAFGSWLFADPDLYEGAKVAKYRTHVSTATPTWLRRAAAHERGMQMLASGASVADTAKSVGVDLSTVYSWKRAA
jgi:hypothetical protein